KRLCGAPAGKGLPVSQSRITAVCAVTAASTCSSGTVLIAPSCWVIIAHRGSKSARGSSKHNGHGPLPCRRKGRINLRESSKELGIHKQVFVRDCNAA